MCEAYLANPAGCTPRLPAGGRAGASLAEHFDASPRFATDFALAGLENSGRVAPAGDTIDPWRSEEPTSELQSPQLLACPLLLLNKKQHYNRPLSFQTG